MKKVKPQQPRNPVVAVARQRKAGVMRDRRARRPKDARRVREWAE